MAVDPMSYRAEWWEPMLRHTTEYLSRPGARSDLAAACEAALEYLARVESDPDRMTFDQWCDRMGTEPLLGLDEIADMVEGARKFQGNGRGGSDLWLGQALRSWFDANRGDTVPADGVRPVVQVVSTEDREV